MNICWAATIFCAPSQALEIQRWIERGHSLEALTVHSRWPRSILQWKFPIGPHQHSHPNTRPSVFNQPLIHLLVPASNPDGSSSPSGWHEKTWRTSGNLDTLCLYIIAELGVRAFRGTRTSVCYEWYLVSGQPTLSPHPSALIPFSLISKHYINFFTWL